MTFALSRDAETGTVWTGTPAHAPRDTGLSPAAYADRTAGLLPARVEVPGTLVNADLVVRLGATTAVAVHRPEGGDEDPRRAVDRLTTPDLGGLFGASHVLSPAALLGWAVVAGHAAPDRHPAYAPFAMVGADPAAAGAFFRHVRDPRWFQPEDPQRTFSAARLFSFLKLFPRTFQAATLPERTWAALAPFETGTADAAAPGGLLRRVAAARRDPVEGKVAAARFFARWAWTWWLSRLTLPDVFVPGAVFKSDAELAAWRAAAGGDGGCQPTAQTGFDPGEVGR